MSVILNVSQVEKYFGSQGSVTRTLDNISFRVEKGEFLGIMGPSGSGKSTLLNCIAGIDSVSTGHIYMEDEDITMMKQPQMSAFRRKHLGLLFQDLNLLDTLNARENIALSLTMQMSPPKEIHQRIDALAKAMGIEELLSCYPWQLSGGQKQCVACARALIKEPRLILADEPTGALDSASSQMLMRTLESINQNMHSTIMMVTHDPFSASYARRILFIKDGHIFNELIRGDDSRKAFFQRILEVTTLLGGDVVSAY